MDGQDAQPRTVIALWNAKIEEPKFDWWDPGVTVFDQSTSKSVLTKVLLSFFLFLFFFFAAFANLCRQLPLSI